MDECLIFYISIYVVTLFIGQIKTLLLNTSSLALRKVKTEQTETLSLGAEKGSLQGHARRMGGSCPKGTQTLMGFRKAFLKKNSGNMHEILLCGYFREKLQQRR